jgi:hypothetical protein
MTRRPGYYMAMILTFVMGGLTLLWRTSALERVNPKDATLPPVEGKTFERTYSIGRVDRVQSPRNGAAATFNYLSSPSGLQFSEWHENHESLASAERVFNEAVSRAETIVERRLIFNAAGREVGEQVVAFFSSDYPHFGTASLLWTHKSTFNYVAGSSVQDIYEFESDQSQRMRHDRFPVDSPIKSSQPPTTTPVREGVSIVR